jgi:hypothetical protein
MAQQMASVKASQSVLKGQWWDEMMVLEWDQKLALLRRKAWRWG